MLGPLLPALSARWHIQDEQAGTLFTVVFVGELCGAWFATRNLRFSVLAGSCITAAGCVLLAWADFGAAHIALFCVGLGLGAGLTAGNVIVGTAATSFRTRLLALLNVAWGAGAIICSLLVRACGPGRVPLFFLILAGCLLLAALFAIEIPPAAPRMAAEAVSPDQGVKRTKTPMPLLPLFLFSLAMLLYVGIENSLGGWLPSYGLRTTTLLASSVALYFWIAELIGRLLLAALTSLFGEATLYRVSVLVLILTTAVLIASAHLGSGGVVALTILSGLALAPVYPLIVSFFLARTGNHPGLGPVFAVASLGGATLPWLTGAISNHFHALRDGLAVPAIGALLLLLLAPEITAQQAK